MMNQEAGAGCRVEGSGPATPHPLPWTRPALQLFCSLAAMAAASSLAAQKPGLEFTIQSLMRGPELVGRQPGRVQWTADGRWIYFLWNEPGTDWREPLRPYRVRSERGARPERVSDMHMDTVGPFLAAGRLSADRRFRAVSYSGDLYLLDVRAGTARRLTETLDAETDPQLGAETGGGGRRGRLFFVRNNNFFALDLESGLTRQLTDIRTGPEPKDSAKAEGQRAMLESQQRALFEAIRDRARLDSVNKAETKTREALRPKALYLGKDERVSEMSVAPSGKAILIVTQISAEKAQSTRVPNYVTLSGYTEDLTVRTKVGDSQASGRVAFMSLPTGSLKWLAVIPGDTVRAPSQVRSLGWNAAGTSALVFAVSKDYKTRYIHRVDADTGAISAVDELRDTAWVNGPCFGCGGWYDGGKRVWYVSEADGFAHVYSVAASGRDKRQLTAGRWEVLSAELSPDERNLYLHTNEGSPFEQHFYVMPVDGGSRKRITTASGGHTASVSPNGQWLADVHSFANKPPELYLMRNQAGAEMSRLTTSPTAEWMSFPWIVPEIVMIPASDGVQVPARIYRAKDMRAEPNGAGAIFVHGAGYLHNVHNYWSSYYREYMFNQYLASQGYVVLDIDYRGSAGYGRDWRTAIYRHMGGRDLQDQVDGARYLQKEFGISPERIGIYGGSYGGFITLMALFTEPKWFGAGAALRSVTDWAHYNHPYTARILNTPEADTVAFRRSSPIFFAEGLEDPLLIAHGMVDVNVHFQDVVRLAQRLIELGKKNWEMAVYPAEDHAFVRPSSWTDEYRRIFELFEKNLRPAATVGGQQEGQK